MEHIEKFAAHLLGLEDGEVPIDFSAVPQEFISRTVRLGDIKEYFTQNELKRKRRLGFQLEILFLCFFFPMCVLWMATYSQLDQAALNIATKRFPVDPILPGESLRNSTFTSFIEGFSNEEQFWQWMNNVVFDEVYNKGLCGLSIGESGVSPYSPYPGLGALLTVGAIRIRQLRVVNKTCPEAASLMNITCYPGFSTDDESTRPIITPYGTFVYQTAAATNERPYIGYFSTYPGSGYAINLTTGLPSGEYCTPASYEAQKNILLNARKASFIGAASRAIIITITTFSPNSGAIVTTRFATEISIGGVFQNSFDNEGIIFFRSKDDTHTMQVLLIFLAIIEIIFVISSLWGVVFAWRVESRTWQLVDIVSSALMITQLYFWLSFFFTPYYEETLESEIFGSKNDWSGTGFYSGEDLSELQTLPIINSIILLMSTLRIFRYSQYLDFMGTIHGTIKRAWTDIVLYFLLLVFLSLGFVLCGMIVLRGNLRSWSNYANAIYTLIEYFVLSMDYYDMQRMQPLGLYFAPIFLASFILIFTWYIFAVFVAVIYAGYRSERMSAQKHAEKMLAWEKNAEKNGAKHGSQVFINTSPVVGNDDASFSGPLYYKRSFYFSNWKESLQESLREFFGLTPRKGFQYNVTILRYLSGYEKQTLSQLASPLLSPQKSFLSFRDVYQIATGKYDDLLIEFDEQQNPLHQPRKRVDNDQTVSLDVDYTSVDDPDAYLRQMNPLAIQISRMFRKLWLIPDNMVETFANFEVDDAAKQIRRSLLVRIQESLQLLGDAEQESTRRILGKLQALQVTQDAMERDMRALRDLLK